MISQMPQAIRHSPRSLELVCLHEAGHVFAALTSGTIPEFVEVYTYPEPYGRSRIPRLEGDERKDLASSGFAVELWLFNEGRLIGEYENPISEKEFLKVTLGDHTSDDKIKFFDADFAKPNGCWPESYDQEFLQWGSRFAKLLYEPFIEECASELLNKKRLDSVDLQRLAERHEIF